MVEGGLVDSLGGKGVMFSVQRPHCLVVVRETSVPQMHLFPPRRRFRQHRQMGLGSWRAC